jgi:hypothetical protein
MFDKDDLTPEWVREAVKTGVSSKIKSDLSSLYKTDFKKFRQLF